MQRDPSMFSIGSVDVEFDRRHVNLGPAPDLILVHFRAVGARANGPHLHGAMLTHGYEDAEFRADGMVSYRGNYYFALEGIGPLLLTYSGMSDIGEEAYERAIDDLLPGSIRLDASARFFTSALNYRWLNKLQCDARGQRDFRGASASCELLAHLLDE